MEVGVNVILFSAFVLDSGQLFVKEIGDKHMPGSMGNAKIGLRLHHNGLGRHTAGPEDWNLPSSDRHRVSKVRSLEIPDSDL